MEIIKEEYEERIRKTRELMGKGGLDGIIAYANYKHGGHVQYLTGYQVLFGGYQSVSPTDVSFFGSALVLLLTKENETPILFSDTFFGSSQEDSLLKDRELNFIHSTDFAEDIVKILKKKNFQGKIGIQGWGIFPTPYYIKLQNSFPSVRFVPSELLERQRMVKSPAEIELIREAEKIATLAVQKGLKMISPGITEKEVCLAVEYIMRKYGDDYIASPSIIGSGIRTLLYNPLATNKKIEKGDLVQIDIAGRYKMYCGDITREQVCGEPTKEQEKLFDAVLKMNETVRKKIKPGIKAAELNKIAHQVAIEDGYPPSTHTRLLGHGVGLDVHERPDFGEEETKLLPGMVITVEPTLLVPNVGGMRIEDLVLVTDSGHEVLSKTERKLC